MLSVRPGLSAEGFFARERPRPDRLSNGLARANASRPFFIISNRAPNVAARAGSAHKSSPPGNKDAAAG